MRNRHRFSSGVYVTYVILCSPLWLFWIHTASLWFTKTTATKENSQLTYNSFNGASDRIYDVIVYGATPSGIMASVTAAKKFFVNNNSSSSSSNWIQRYSC